MGHVCNPQLKGDVQPLMLKPLPAARWNFTTAAHLLNRAGFGGSPAEIEQLVEMGPEKAVEHFIEFEKFEDTIEKPEWAHPDPERLQKLRTLRQGSPEDRRKAQMEFQQEQRRHLIELRHWWLRRMALGRRPLEEKLTLFWHGHFATSAQKVKDTYLMFLQNETFRRHAAGGWLDMLEKVSKDPAMLQWLDQAQSRKQHPNENYAREVMELFALGEGHYTETDILEAARALTGWTINRFQQTFMDDPALHDDRTKTIFGQTGNFNGMDVLRLIAEQKQSALFITGKLWRFFANDAPMEPVIDALATEFQNHGREFKPMLRTLFRSEEFYAPDVIRNQVKSPVQWLVGSVRQLERELPPPPACTFLLSGLGQDLFMPPNVKGWDGGVAWITTNNLLNRYNESALLVEGQNLSGPMGPGRPGGAGGGGPARPMAGRFLGGAMMRGNTRIDVAKIVPAAERKNPETIIAALEKRFLQATLKPAQQKTLGDFLRAQTEVTDREILHVTRLIMSTPEFQLT